ncbi:DUF3180 family protein [Miniimonas arenae]|uniref:DUF3180 family protein n=1 Tax=Miniimonas arenae TaxID=676201 RepID=A0A5C5BF27_9MICO|nr:DUF3180 family protein [Miniimonas arenae]TNU76717.1 DUF3180 family protein [Miniimonas arenae]
MVRARPVGLIVAALIGFTVVFLVLQWASSRGTSVPAPLVVPILLLVGAVVVLALGWRVRQLVRGRGTMDAIAAARVAALAVTAALVGAAMVGAGAAQIAAVAAVADAPAARRDVLVGSATLVAALLCVAAGLLVQHWCRVPDDPDDPRGSGRRGGPPADPA